MSFVIVCLRHVSTAVESRSGLRHSSFRSERSSGVYLFFASFAFELLKLFRFSVRPSPLISAVSAARKMSSDVNAWFKLKTKVLTLTGEPVEFSELWKSKRTVIFLVRRFGCALCQEHAADLVTLWPELEKSGCQMVAVGTGSEYYAKRFKEITKWPGDVFLDHEGGTYKALELPRFSVFNIFRWRVIQAFRAAVKKGFDNHLKEDGLQSGGVFVIGPGAASPLLSQWRESDDGMGTKCDLELLLKAART